MHIQEEIEKMGALKSSAQMIVDYVRTMSPASKFNRYSEWNLEPDTWIVLSFAYTHTKTITLTLGVPVESLPNTTDLNIAPRYQWAKIYVKKIQEMPAVMEDLRYAYFSASNRYRKQFGLPKIAKKR
jgi:hypothetical protein